MTKADEERCKNVSDVLMDLIVACHDEVGRDYKETREDYEIAVVEAYMLMCSAHSSPIRGIDISAKSIVTFGRIFDLVHILLDMGVIGEVKSE